MKHTFKLGSTVINVIASAFLLALCNVSFWQQFAGAYPMTISNLPFTIGMISGLWCFFYLILTFISFKYLYKPVVILLFILAAVSAYAMDTFSYIISSYSFVNIAETDQNEISDLMSWKLLVYVTCLAAIPGLLLSLTKVEYPRLKTQLLHILIIVALIAVNLGMFNKSYASFLRNHKEVRYYLNPVRTVYSLIKFVAEKFKDQGEKSYQILDPDPMLADHNGKPRLIVLVVGESDRAVNHALNGYARPTNPLLAQRDDVFSFQQVYSCGTETSVSVPCMFSSFTRDDFNYVKGRYTQNVLDILQQVNVQVVWRDNDSGCKNVCDRVIVEDLNNATIAPYCKDGECHDEVLLHDLERHFTNDVQDKLIVLHKKGNHGPAYFKRYPQRFEVFTPTCQSNELQDCSNEQIVNTYDNIVLYTDFFLDHVITQLQKHNDKYQTAMIYVSDHGESLGEHGVYLHAMPYWLAPKEQTHIPFIVWFSEDFKVDRKLLKQLEQQELSHDHLFHTLLGLYRVKTVTYNSELDLLS